MTRSAESAPAGVAARPGTSGRGDAVLFVLLVTDLALIAAQFALAGFGAFAMDKTPTDNAYGAHMVMGLAIAAGEREGIEIVNAIGAETYSYRELVEMIAATLGLRRWGIGVHPRLGYAMGWALGRLLGDVMITWEEVGGLSAGLLAVDAEPTGTTRLSVWAAQHRGSLGHRYANELARRNAAVG